MLSLSTPTILKTLCYNLPSFRSMLSIFGFIQGLSTHHFKQQQKLENSIMTIEMQCMSRSFQICYYFYLFFFFEALYTSSKPRTHSRRWKIIQKIFFLFKKTFHRIFYWVSVIDTVLYQWPITFFFWILQWCSEFLFQ